MAAAQEVKSDQRKSDRISFKVLPLSPLFGGEVKGFDLKTLLLEQDPSTFLRTVSAHGLLVFRDQELSPADFAGISRFCGELEYHVLDQYRMPSQPEIYVISNIVENGKPIGNPRDGFGWHTDQSYVARPTAYTLLYGVETPPVGADTLFCDTCRAYDSLSTARRDQLRKLRGTHSYIYMRTGNKAYIENNAATQPLSATQVSRVPDVTHPMVRTNPHTGRLSLYLGGDCLAGIDGMPDEEARPLVDELFAITLRPEVQVAHKWQPHDVVIWDNRGLMHTATDYDREQYRRLIWRTSVRGEVPY